MYAPVFWLHTCCLPVFHSPFLRGLPPSSLMVHCSRLPRHCSCVTPISVLCGVNMGFPLGLSSGFVSRFPPACAHLYLSFSWLTCPLPSSSMRQALPSSCVVDTSFDSADYLWSFYLCVILRLPYFSEYRSWEQRGWQMSKRMVFVMVCVLAVWF